MLKFEVYQGSETLTDLGTVAQAVGAKGTLALIPKNLKGSKRVAIVLKNRNGESTVISCSTNVSDEIRSALAKGVDKKRVLAIIAKLNIMEGESEIPYICAPAGEGSGLEEFVIETLSKEAVGYETFLTF